MNFVVDTRIELTRSRQDQVKADIRATACCKGMVAQSPLSAESSTPDDGWCRRIPEDDDFDSSVSDTVARPLEFPTPLVWEAELRELICLDPKTEMQYPLQNVLVRVGQNEDGKDETDNAESYQADRAYFISKKLSKSTHGTIRLGIVLQRRNIDIKSQSDYDAALFGPQWESTDEMVSIKVSSWERINNMRGRHLVDPIKEIAALQHVGNNHPHVAGCIEVLQDDNNLYTVSRYCPNGDLYSAIDPPDGPSLGRVNEGEARNWFRQLLLGLVHLQQKGVCHKNINFDTLMIDQKNQLVISDFSLSLRVPHRDAGNGGQVTDVSEGSERLKMTAQGQSGKLMFLAPEILEDKPFDGYAADLWSAAVVLFVLLVGVAPFQMAQPCDKRYEKIVEGQLQELLESFDISLSPEALDLLQCMFQEDPDDRLSLAGVLRHPWVMDQRFPSPPSAEQDTATPKIRTSKTYLCKSSPPRLALSVPRIRGPEQFVPEEHKIPPRSASFETKSVDGTTEMQDDSSVIGSANGDSIVNGDSSVKTMNRKKSDYFIGKLKAVLKKKHYGTM